MNNSGAELSSYFMWILVQKKGGMQFHIVQRHGSASTAVLKKKNKKKKTENESAWGWRCVLFLFCFFFLYQQSCGPLLPSPPHKTELVIEFGFVPSLLCLTVKVESEKE